MNNLDSIPILKSNISLQEEPTGAVLFDLENDTYKLISSFEAFIFSLFDGQRTLADIISILKHLKKSPNQSDILNDIFKFIEIRYKYIEFVDDHSKIANPKLDPKMFLSKSCDIFLPPKRLSKPRNLVLYVTRRCNLNCVYCFANASIDNLDTNREMPTEKILQLITQFAELGIKSVTVTGGEPTLRYDLPVIIHSIKRHDIEVFLATNACFIDDNTAKELKNSGIRQVQTKLDAADAQLQDRLSRVSGSYNKLINGIGTFVEHSLVVSVVSVITSWNIKNFPQVVEKCIELGVEEVKPRIYTPGIFALKNRGGSYLNPSLESILSLEKSIEELRSEHGETIKISRLDVAKLEMNRENNVPSCPGLITTCCILDNGLVTPCEMLPDVNDDFIIGNVNFESLIDIWNSKKAQGWATRNNINVGDICKSCDEFMRCKGGCPWKAIVAYGSWLCDPTCICSPRPLKIPFAEVPNRS